MVIMDVWGGYQKRNHIVPRPVALAMANSEVECGYLVAFHEEPDWEEFENFDVRVGEFN